MTELKRWDWKRPVPVTHASVLLKRIKVLEAQVAQLNEGNYSLRKTVIELSNYNMALKDKNIKYSTILIEGRNILDKLESSNVPVAGFMNLRPWILPFLKKCGEVLKSY